MKHIFGAAGVLSAILFAAGVGHATDGWVQIPGLATQIAVGANDIPFVLDINGNVQYLALPQRVCTPQNLCVLDARQWTMANTTASVIACDQYGYLWKTDAAGGLSNFVPSKNAFDTTLVNTQFAAPISSLAPGRMQPPYNEWNVPFGTAATPAPLPVGQVARTPITTTYFTGSDSPSLSSLDLARFDQDTWDGGSTLTRHTGYWQPSWTQIDTGELQVTQFTIDNSADQVPWFFVYSTGGYRTPYAMPSPGTYRNTGVPTVFGVKFDVDWMTDHYVAASHASTSAVWHWTGNAYGSGGQWILLANSQYLPNGGKIAKIAYASALPGTSVGTIGPSHLYMIDSFNNIYQWGTLGGPVK